MQQPLSLSAILDNALLPDFDIAASVLRKERLVEQGAHNVGRVGSAGIGSGDRALLQAVQLKVGLGEGIGNLRLEGRGKVALVRQLSSCLVPLT